MDPERALSIREETVLSVDVMTLSERQAAMEKVMNMCISLQKQSSSSSKVENRPQKIKQFIKYLEPFGWKYEPLEFLNQWWKFEYCLIPPHSKRKFDPAFCSSFLYQFM
jgi:hypothetical protein